MSLYTSDLEAVLRCLPATVTVGAVDFHRSGKLGTDIRTGQAAAEYSDALDRRVWVLADGTAGEVE